MWCNLLNKWDARLSPADDTTVDSGATRALSAIATQRADRHALMEKKKGPLRSPSIC